jgi:hypothetical protein
VAAIIEHRHIGIARSAGKANRSGVHSCFIQIDAEDGLKTGAFQCFGYIMCVIRWVRQMRSIHIGAIPNDQRYPLIGRSWAA